MLHALTQGKTELYKRYSGKNSQSFFGEKRNTPEDEITALIFSPLAFLPSERIGLFWHQILKLDAPLPISGTMEFWPKRRSDNKNRSFVEPELYVQLKYPDRTNKHIIVEFKWDSPLSGNENDDRDQLTVQWEDFPEIRENEKKESFHIFVGKKTSEADEIKKNSSLWRDDQLIIFSWVDLIGQMKKIAQSTPSLELWIEQVSKFMAKLNLKPFGGFNHISDKCISVSTPNIFFKKPF